MMEHVAFHWMDLQKDMRISPSTIKGSRQRNLNEQEAGSLRLAWGYFPPCTNHNSNDKDSSAVFEDASHPPGMFASNDP